MPVTRAAAAFLTVTDSTGRVLRSEELDDVAQAAGGCALRIATIRRRAGGVTRSRQGG
jgi:hypothetical protein